MDLSIISPVYNEQDSIEAFVSKLVAEVDLMNTNYEIILVDDGSEDGSWSIIQDLCQRLPRLKGIRLIKNQGQMAALEIGILSARGEWLVTMDSDLQHPPEFIQDMWLIRDRASIVNTKQQARHDSWSKSLFSRLFYVLLAHISGFKVEQNVGDFRLIRRETALLLLSKDEPKLLRFLIPKYGLDHEILEYQASPRYAGSTKYSLQKMISLALASTLISSKDIPYSFVKFGFGVFAMLMCQLGLIVGMLVLSRDVSFLLLATIFATFNLMIALLITGFSGMYFAEMLKSSIHSPSVEIAEKIGF